MRACAIRPLALRVRVRVVWEIVRGILRRKVRSLHRRPSPEQPSVDALLLLALLDVAEKINRIWLRSDSRS